MTTERGSSVVTTERGTSVVTTERGSSVVTTERGNSVLTTERGSSVVTTERGTSVVTTERGLFRDDYGMITVKSMQGITAITSQNEEINSVVTTELPRGQAMAADTELNR